MAAGYCRVCSCSISLLCNPHYMFFLFIASALMELKKFLPYDVSHYQSINPPVQDPRTVKIDYF